MFALVDRIEPDREERLKKQISVQVVHRPDRAHQTTHKSNLKCARIQIVFSVVYFFIVEVYPGRKFDLIPLSLHYRPLFILAKYHLHKNKQKQ